jgi:hypothetical protein
MVDSWDNETTHGWYDRGGFLVAGPTETYNATGTAEMVRGGIDYIRDRYGDPETPRPE